MIDMNVVLTKLQEMQQEITYAMSDAESAASNAEDAENYAYDARSAAESADNSAVSAKDRANEAYQRLDELDDQIKEFMEEVEQAIGVEGEKSLANDILKWTKPVSARLKNGYTVSQISSDLGITEILVQCVIDDIKRKEAA